MLLVTPTVVGLIGALHWKYSDFLWVTDLWVTASCVRDVANAIENDHFRRAAVKMFVVRLLTLVEQPIRP